MSKGDIVIGLDVGSSNVRAVILQKFEEEEKPRVVGVGVAPSAGMRRGVVADVEETIKSISRSESTRLNSSHEIPSRMPSSA